MASKGEKISKSKGNSKVEPRELVKTHSADSIRYWAGTGRLGNDIIFSEETLARGQKLINKLWNVSKFIEMHIHDYNENKEKFKDKKQSPCLPWADLPFPKHKNTDNNGYQKCQ